MAYTLIPTRGAETLANLYASRTPQLHQEATNARLTLVQQLENERQRVYAELAQIRQEQEIKKAQRDAKRKANLTAGLGIGGTLAGAGVGGAVTGTLAGASLGATLGSGFGGGVAQFATGNPNGYQPIQGSIQRGLELQRLFEDHAPIATPWQQVQESAPTATGGTSGPNFGPYGTLE